MNYLKRFSCYAMLMMLFCCMAGLASCSDDDDADVVNGVGTITGTITDDYNAPLAGVKVAIDGGATTTTSATGEYTLTDVPVGRTVITFSKDDYQTVSVTVTAKSYSNGVALVNASMEYAAAKITGQILDAKNGNSPLAGVTVSVSETQSVTTGADGKFTISNLPLDAYMVSFTKDGYATITRTVGIDQFIDGVATINVTMGGRQVLRDKTMDDLLNADHWYYNEYRGGRNAESYPHWDWSTDYMATMDFYGCWEEQNEGTTLQIRNNGAEQANPADLNVFDSYIYGIKHITADNAVMTVQCRTHNATADEPTVWGVQVIDLSEAEPEAVKIGDNRTLASENYSPEAFDLSAYIGKDVVIAIGTYRAKTGDYWKQLVLRRIAFANTAIDGWAWLPGTPINDELDDWTLTQEMIRSTMPQTKFSFTGISPVGGNRDNYVEAYRAWREVGHIGAEWSFVPRVKDPEPFAGEGFVMKTRGGGTPVNVEDPEAFFYTKFAIENGHNHFVMKCRNFSGSNATFYKLTAIDDNMNVEHLQPSKVEAQQWEAAAGGCVKFIHEDGGAGSPEKYATFEFDLSKYNGKNVTLVLGVYKGEDNGDENKLCIYSINMN